MKYYFDTEFIERGPQYPIELISIGIVAEDGRELYCVSKEFDPKHANEWVRENVLPHVGDEPRLSWYAIGQRIIGFCGDKPEFWAYYCNYDWVVLCQIFGSMMDLPKGWPMYCNDLTVEARRYGNPELPKQDSTEHNALNDARWTKAACEWTADYGRRHEALRELTRMTEHVGGYGPNDSMRPELNEDDEVVYRVRDPYGKIRGTYPTAEMAAGVLTKIYAINIS